MNRIESEYFDFGRIMREKRKLKRFSQERLALMVGLSRVSIANIENGKQRVLLHDALAIGNLLGISLDSISQNRNEPNLRELLNMQGEDIKSNILSVLASIKKGDDDG